jgi:predicted nucleic acid-binding protein
MIANTSPRSFIDTNILVYADDGLHPVKQQKAVQLLSEHRRNKTGVISLQVLQEYFVTAKNKLKLDVALARAQLEYHSGLDVAVADASDILAAIDLHRLYGFSFWDSLILQMAKRSGCRVILTEDMQHGQIIDGVEIVNPFI